MHGSSIFDHFDLAANHPNAAEHVGAAFRAYVAANRVTDVNYPLPAPARRQTGNCPDLRSCRRGHCSPRRETV
jgi:hypothetical protein